MNVLVVYWSGTGNTEAMAKAVAQGVEQGGATPDLMTVSKCTAAQAAEYSHIAFGCPSMGDEVLEESEMEPFFTELEKSLSGKKVALFGSYDWGDGQWMREWVERSIAAGATVCQGEGLIHQLDPDKDALEKCSDLGHDLAKM